MNLLTLKYAEFLTAWSLATPEERMDFQVKHGPIAEPPVLLGPQNVNKSAALSTPMTHDAHGPVYFRDLDAEALREGKLVRKK